MTRRYGRTARTNGPTDGCARDRIGRGRGHARAVRLARTRAIDARSNAAVGRGRAAFARDLRAGFHARARWNL